MGFVKLVAAIFVALSLFAVAAVFLLSWRVAYEERTWRAKSRERAQREHVD